MSNSLQQDGEFRPLEVLIIKCWKSDIAIYDIEITNTVNDTKWIVTKRYKEFYEMHQQLSKIDTAIREAPFPPKKSFNNLALPFLQERKLKLQEYLNIIFEKYPIPPDPLAHFIDWNLYDIHGITNILAKHFFDNAEIILKKCNQFEFNVLQIYAINERLKSQSPTNLTTNPAFDFTHVVDFVSKIKSIKVVGSPTSVRTSNIIMNKLECDLCRFNLNRLELNNVDLKQVRGFDRLKSTVQYLKINHSIDKINNVALGDLLSLGNGDWVFGKDAVPTSPWSCLYSLDLSHNFLHSLDSSMALFRNVKSLTLNNNILTSIEHIDRLVNLTTLNLCNNKLGLTYTPLPQPASPVVSALSNSLSDSQSDDNSSMSWNSSTNNLNLLRCRLGNVTVLNLANNLIRNTSIISGLYSLIKLNLSNNLITELSDLDHLKNLPCIGNLVMLGNGVCSKPGYRRYVLQLFGDRFSEIFLDLRKADAIEFMKLRVATDSILEHKNNVNVLTTVHPMENDIIESEDMENGTDTINIIQANSTNDESSEFASTSDNSDNQTTNLDLSLGSDNNNIIVF